MKQWLLNWIASPGLWRGAIYILAAAGITFQPGQENAIIAAGLALSGIIHAFETGADSKP